MDGDDGRDDGKLLELFQRRQAVLRDRVRGVAGGHYPGAYIFGQPGTGKTHASRTALSDVDAPYSYHCGHLTSMGFFELLGEHADETLVLDDVGAILFDRVGLQLMLGAVGHQPHGCGPRVVKYKRQGREEVVHFRGGIVLISNLELHPAPLLEALRSRVHVLRYAPTDEELAAQMRHLCTLGWPASRPLLTPDECRRVADFVIAESRRIGRRLDFRLVFDKAFGDYLQFRMGEAELHWRDLVLSALRESGEVHAGRARLAGRAVEGRASGRRAAPPRARRRRRRAAAALAGGDGQVRPRVLAAAAGDRGQRERWSGHNGGDEH